MTARSPSPNPTRHANPNPQTLESISNSNIRRSGSFSLSKNSITAEIPQRNSKAGRDVLPCLRASFNQKENERDSNCLKTPRGRSPTVSSSKGAKSFMAPTISASSKAIGASPLKKILTERNSMTPVFHSNEFPARQEAASGSEMGSSAQMVLVAAKSTNLSSQGVGMEEVPLKSEMGSGFREIVGSAESRKVDPMIKNCHCVEVPSFSPSPVIATLDADPSLPPYDPKTNFLSPRPRFLHYKPNPRTEHYLDKDGDGKRLEDSFSSESYDDASENTEEAHSSPLRQESDEESSPAKAEQESEEDSSPTKAEQEPEEESSPTKAETEEVTSGTHVSEPKSNSKSRLDGNGFKPWFSRRSKLLPLLLVLIIVCLSAPLSDSPVMSSSSMLKVHSFGNLDAPSLPVFEDLYLKDYVARANVHLRGLVTRFKHWSVSSIDYLSTVAFIPKELGSFDIGNITFSAVDETEDLDFIFSSTKFNEEPKTKTDQAIEESMVEETEREIAMEVSEATEEDDTEYGPEEIEMEVFEEVKGGEIKIEETEALNVEVVSEEQEVKGGEIKIEEIEALNVEVVSEEQEVVKEDVHPMEIEMENEIKEDGMKDMEHETSNSGHEELNTDEVVREEHEVLSLDLVIGPKTADNQEELPAIDSEDKHSMRTTFGLSAAVAMLATTFAFLYMKRKGTSVAAHERHRTKEVVSVSGSSESYSYAKGSPSEVSNSLHSSSSFGRRRAKRGIADEPLSNEGRPRRDSAVSTSISYGSFTTYEKFSAKKGCRDDDSVTPVRRSSRIRNQVTSP